MKKVEYHWFSRYVTKFMYSMMDHEVRTIEQVWSEAHEYLMT